MEFSYPLPLESKLVVKGIWYRKDYDNIDSLHNIKREDDKYSIGLELSRPLFYKWLEVQLEYNYTKNDSNISDYDYKRNTITLYIIANM